MARFLERRQGPTGRSRRTPRVSRKPSNVFILLYFSILLHCIVQWVLVVMLPSACSFIVDVSLSYI
jgi:hypothetical protein